MKIPTIRRIFKEDLAKSGPLPEWVDALLDPLNNFINQVVLALRQNLTFSENVFCKVFTGPFTHDVELSVNPQNAKNPVVGVFPIASGAERVDSFGWQRKTNGDVGVTFSFVGGSATTQANCTIIILYGVT